MFDLPNQGVALGSYNLVNRYPNINFFKQVFFAGVPGENRVVVLQQSGFVHVFVDDVNTSTSQLVLDISSQVLLSGEEVPWSSNSPGWNAHEEHSSALVGNKSDPSVLVRRGSNGGHGPEVGGPFIVSFGPLEPVSRQANMQSPWVV